MAFVTAVVAFFSDSATFKFSGFWFVVTVAIVFIGIHLFDNYYLRPRVLGHGLSLHPAVVLFAVIGALTLDGALLVLIIVPLISSIIVVLRYLFSRLTGADPWEKEIIEGFPEEKETVQMIRE